MELRGERERSPELALPALPCSISAAQPRVADGSVYLTTSSECIAAQPNRCRCSLLV